MLKNYIAPRLKPFVEVLSDNKKIYFFKRPGVAITLEDETGFIFSICKLMDGVKNLDELCRNLALSHPNETPYLIDLLRVLDNELLLEDIARHDSENLTEYDVLRWSRNIEFFGAYTNALTNKYSLQKKIKSTKVVLLGLGGVGSHILHSLAALGVETFRIIDFDKVELSNLNRQILYNESDVGKLKTRVAKKRLLQFSPHANIKIFNEKISCIENIERMVDGQDIVISAADQPRDKIIDWVNAACIKKNVPFLCGALDSKWAIYYTVIPGKTGCIECWKTKAKKTGLIFQDVMNQQGFIAASALGCQI